jgi:hypothetical protein
VQIQKSQDWAMGSRMAVADDARFQSRNFVSHSGTNF